MSFESVKSSSLKFLKAYTGFLAVFFILIVVLTLGVYFKADKFFGRSEGRLFLKDNRVRLELSIAEKDKAKALKFLEKIGMSEALEGVEIEVDEKTRDWLGRQLPAELNLDFEESELNFSNSSLNLINSGLSGKEYNLEASNGARAKLKVKSDRDYSFIISNPRVILEEATRSGEIFLSSKILEIFPILSKVDTIEFESNNGNIKGKVRLQD